MRPGVVIARAEVTGPRAFRDELGESLVQPARDPIRVKAMQNQMRDLVAKQVTAVSEAGIALDKKAALRMDPTGPRLQPSRALELLPVRARLKNVDVRFCIARRLLALQFLRHHAIMEL